MQFIRKTAAAIATLACLSSAPALASSLDTDVDVTIPSVIALYCYDNIAVDVSADSFLTAVGGVGDGETLVLNRNARAAAGRWTVRAPRRKFRRGAWKPRNNVNLFLTGVCAYRAIGERSGVQVSVEAGETRLEAPGGSFITVRNVRARDADRGGRWRQRYRIRGNQLGFNTVRGIDLRLRLNLRRAKEAGTYSSETDGTFKVMVIASP